MLCNHSEVISKQQIHICVYLHMGRSTATTPDADEDFDLKHCEHLG
jgi:hypothetical protein